MASDYKTSVQWSPDFGCPSGWSTPTQSDLNDLVSSSQAGSSKCLFEQDWNNDGYWSSSCYGRTNTTTHLWEMGNCKNDKSGNDHYHYLYFDKSYMNVAVTYGADITSHNVRCVSP